MKKCLQISATFIAAIVGACAGKVEYSQPTAPKQYETSKVVNKGKEQVWVELIPALGKQFFVINNLDKESGLINISYSGDPEVYIDCGRIKSYVSNANGERTYDFPAARAYQVYEIMDMENGTGYWQVERKMELEGRMNLIVQALSDTTTQLTANTKYIVSRTIDAQGPSGRDNWTDSISFNSGQSARLPKSESECRSTGKFEQDVLQLIN